MFLILLLYFSIATTFIFGKILLGYVPPMFLIALRMLVAGIILLSAYIVTSKKPQFRRRKDYLFFVGTSIFHILIPFQTEYIAMETINPSSVCLFYNLSPLISAVMSYFFFKERMNVKKWLGLFVSMIGIFYFTTPLFFVAPFAHFKLPSWEHLLMLVSVTSSCLGWIFVRILVRNRGFSPLFINGVSMLVGGALSLPMSRALEGRINIFEIPDLSSFALLLGALILVANFVFYNLYGYLLKKYTATILSFFGLLTPLFVASLEHLFLDSATISYDFFISIIIISVGLYIFYQEELQQGYIS